MPGRGLVEQQQLRRGGQRERHLELACARRATARRPARAPRPASPTSASSSSARADRRRCRRGSRETAAVRVALHGQRDVLGRGHRGEQARVLERLADPEPGALAPRTSPVTSLPVELDPAGGRRARCRRSAGTACSCRRRWARSARAGHPARPPGPRRRRRAARRTCAAARSQRSTRHPQPPPARVAASRRPATPPRQQVHHERRTRAPSTSGAVAAEAGAERVADQDHQRRAEARRPTACPRRR